MSSYGVFARYYDTLTADVRYPELCRHLRHIFDLCGWEPHLVLDLACGTGSLTLEMAKAGYEMIGVDRSPAMLSVAKNKLDQSRAQAVLVCQNMCELDLYGTVDAVVCCLDSINHLTSSDQIRDAFNRVSLFLNPGGLFIFDVNTAYKFRNTLSDNTFVYDCDSVYCIWQNQYRPKTKLCRFDLTFFEKSGHSYKRYDEHFYEKCYSRQVIEKHLARAGLILEQTYQELTLEHPQQDCQRMFFVARKPLGETIGGSHE